MWRRDLCGPSLRRRRRVAIVQGVLGGVERVLWMTSIGNVQMIGLISDSSGHYLNYTFWLFTIRDPCN